MTPSAPPVTMNRRNFLGSAATTGLLGLAGSSQTFANEKAVQRDAIQH